MSYVRCDKCDQEAPSMHECLEQGWYMDGNFSVAGIPMVLLCPPCAAKRLEISVKETALHNK